MPHLHLSLSKNLSDFPFKAFIYDAHHLLADYADIEKCKSRLTLLDDIYIANNAAYKGFIYLELALLPRPESILQELGQKLHQLLQSYSKPLLQAQQLEADINLELRVLSYYW